MSTILKALRQSEASRRTRLRLGRPEPAPHRTARWRGPARFIPGIMLLFVAAITIWYLWPQRGDTGEQASARIEQVSVPAQQPAEEAGAGNEAVSPPAHDVAATAGTRKATAREPDPSPETEREPAQPEPRITEQRRGEPARATSRLAVHALLPRLSDLPEGRKAALPPLALNAHVYADEPTDRFVLINLERYGEGDRIAPGLRIEEIYAGGVVLADPEGRFVLPRP